jgi:hypothetical protein
LWKELRVDLLEHLLVDNAAGTLLLEAPVHDLNLLLAEASGLDELLDGPGLVARYLRRGVLEVVFFEFFFLMKKISK